MSPFLPFDQLELDEIRREALEFAGIGLYRYTFDGRVVFMDQGALRILDLQARHADPDEVRGKDISDLIIYVGPHHYLRDKIREHGHIRNLEYPFRTLTGKDRWALHDSYLVRNETTGEEMIQVIIRDITQIKAVELALEREKERLAVTLRSIGDGVITTEVDGRVNLLNAVAEDLIGWSQAEALGRPLGEVFRSVDARTSAPCEDPAARVLAGDQPVGAASGSRLIARDGTRRLIAYTGAPIRDAASRMVGVVLVFRDITAQARLEEELQRIERMSSLGVLAGGLAHDFNNLLTGILGIYSLIKLRTREENLRELAGEGEAAAMNAKELTSQLLTFAKGGTPLRRPTPLPELVRETTQFALRGSECGAIVALPTELWLADVDAGQIRQVINNLALNAMQAMPEGGRVEVTGANLAVTEEGAMPLHPGRYVKLAITDHGTGIPDNLLGKIFDPFFTTKQRGTGLGLSTSFSIVKKHGGHLSVRSTLGEGSTFEIYLPAAAGPVSTARPGSGIEGPVAPAGRILIMDDEASVRRVLARMLEGLGHRVVPAGDGAEAIDLFRASMAEGDRFDAVILDLTVRNGMGGKEAVKRLLELDPTARVIVSSGYSTDAIMSDWARHGFMAVLPKPFGLRELEVVLESALSSRRRS